jgi:hypothetical protein
MNCRRVVSFATALAVVLTAQVRTGVAQGKDPKIWEGVYSSDQATRAQKPFTAVCRRCHNDDMGGSDRGPSLKGERFMANWETQGVNALFAKIRDTMPPDSPSSLPDSDYTDLVSLILKANGFPAGPDQLSADTMAGVMIMRKGGSEAKEVANFRLVEVTGCLTPGPNATWLLTNSTEPVLSNDQPSSAAALQQAATLPASSKTFRLVSAGGFNPGPHTGHKMQAKGLLYRAPDKDRINLISLEMVSPSCAS